MSYKTGQVGQELGSVPFGELIKSVALGIAEGQFALDKSSMVVAEFMSGNRLLRDLDTGDLLDESGQPLAPDDEIQFIDSRIFFGYEFQTLGKPASGTGVINGFVDEINVINGGSGYASVPTVTISGGGGSGAAAVASIDGLISSIKIDEAGTGYDENSPPTVTINGGGGSGAVAQAFVNGAGEISAIRILDPGSGYSGVPDVEIDPPAEAGKTAAAATAVLDATVVRITVTNPGSGYDSIPEVSIGDPATGIAVAAASAVLDGEVSRITVSQGGSKYDFPPDVEIIGDGTGATATATVDNGRVSGFRITNPGSGYSEAQIIVSGGKVPERVPRKLSMMELGFAPNFYQFVDTVINIKITVNMVQEETASKPATPRTTAVSRHARYSSRSTRATGNWWRSSYRSTSRSASYSTHMVTRSVDPATSSKYNYAIEASSEVRTKIVPIPPPAILEERIRQNMELDKEYQELLLKR